MAKLVGARQSVSRCRTGARQQRVLCARHTCDARVNALTIEKCRDRPSYWAVAKAHPVTATILLANVAVFAVDQLLTNGLLVVAGMKSNPAIARGQIYRLLSCTFLHGGLVHLLMNMNALYNARITERLLGAKTYTAAYATSGLAGSLMSYALSPHNSVGASGAIMGVFGAFWMTLYDNKAIFGEASASVRRSLMTSVGLTLALGLFVPLVDNWGHLGGLIGGVAFTYLFGPKVDVRKIGKRTQILNSPRISLTGPKVIGER